MPTGKTMKGEKERKWGNCRGSSTGTRKPKKLNKNEWKWDKSSRDWMGIGAKKVTPLLLSMYTILPESGPKCEEKKL